jgi:hypothetical protein
MSVQLDYEYRGKVLDVDPQHRVSCAPSELKNFVSNWRKPQPKFCGFFVSYS